MSIWILLIEIPKPSYAGENGISGSVEDSDKKSPMLR